MLRLDYNLLFTILNLLILYFLMKKFLFSPVNTILQKRRELLDSQYAEASLTKEDALKLKDEYDAAMKSAKNISDQIVADAKVRANAEYDKMMKKMDDEAKKMLEKAQQDIELERSRALRKMKSEITELAMAVAVKIVSDQSSKENDHKLYDQFLAEIGEKTMTEDKGKQFMVEAGELQ